MEQFKKISSVNIALIIINIILFLIPDFFGFLISGDVLLEKGTVIPLLVTEGGEYYRLFTSIFLHFDIRHLLNNMLVLFVLGEKLENCLGHVKYLLFYILCGIGANLIFKIRRAVYHVGRSVRSYFWRNRRTDLDGLQKQRTDWRHEQQAAGAYGDSFAVSGFYQYGSEQCGPCRRTGDGNHSGNTISCLGFCKKDRQIEKAKQEA